MEDGLCLYQGGMEEVGLVDAEEMDAPFVHGNKWKPKGGIADKELFHMSAQDKKNGIGGFSVKWGMADSRNYHRKFPLPNPTDMRCQVFGMLDCVQRRLDDLEIDPLEPWLMLIPLRKDTALLLRCLREYDANPRASLPKSAATMIARLAKLLQVVPVTIRAVEDPFAQDETLDPQQQQQPSQEESCGETS